MARMKSRLTLLGGLIALGAAWVIVLTNAPVQAAPPPPNVEATVALGRVVTYNLSLNNLGQPATTVRLYEGWPPGVAHSSSAPLGPLRVSLPQRPGPITDELLHQLAAAPDGRAEMLLYLNEQADLSAAASLADWEARGWAVMEALRAQAAQTQGPLLAEISARGFEPRSYWIVNLIAVTGDRALVDWAASRAEVALVTENAAHSLGEITPGAVTAASGNAWGLERVRAPRVWETWGVRGEGIVVATIDSGAQYTHTALTQAYRGWSPSGISHAYNWFDPTPKNPAPEPTDRVGHGSHVMGTLVGGVIADGLHIGIAPAARWMAARGCQTTFCTDEALIASAQWLLAPTDESFANPRPDLRPHIINNSWGAPGESKWYAGFVEAWNAAGMFSAFANGNTGSIFGCGSSTAPGNYAAAFAVGATDSDDFIAPFSSRGPTSDGRIKPDVSAPGVDVPSAWLDNGSVLLSGTSMATPHVAGVAALLWSANPGLIGDIAATRALLTGTSRPRTGADCDPDPNAHPNNTYGWGRVDAYAAVQAARVNVPWLHLPAQVTLAANSTYTLEVMLDTRQVSAAGQYSARILQWRGTTVVPIPVLLNVTPATDTVRLTGQLRDRWTGAGVYGQVDLGGPRFETDAAGSFTATLPSGTYVLTTTAVDYVPVTLSTALLTDAVRLITLTADAPHMQVLAPVLSATLPFAAQSQTPFQVSNLGPQPLSVSLSVPPLEWSVNATGAALYDLSAFAPLPLADDMIYTDALTLPFTLPVYGALYDRLYLSTNGWVSVQPPLDARPQAACSGNTLLPAGSLAAFWTDLDPSQGGAVRAGAVDADTFVISWEAVPAWRATPDPAGPTFTFQIIVRSEGSVEYRYGTMGTLPWPWSVAVFGGPGREQTLSCVRGGDPQSLGGLGWRLKNQPLPAFWLSGAPATVTVPPNGTATLTATLSGLGYVPWRTEPFQSVLRLSSNDPLQPQADITAQISPGPPAAQLWLPVIGR
jgi:hypothetical protein